MIHTAYIDCFSGLSGDMFLGAVIDAGVDGDQLFQELKQLGLTGYEVDLKRESRHEICGTRVKIISNERHAHRNINDIENIVALSNLPAAVIDRSMKMFRDLVRVEARIHGIGEEEVTLHEVGAVDAILDIVGTCLAFHKLDVTKIIASPVPLGSGFVKAQHGTLPVPAPATIALLEGIPCYASQTSGELTTPTGATIIKNLAQEFGPMPMMNIAKTGYGVGTKKYNELPNLLRIITGYSGESPASETAVVVQANIDDQIPEQLPYLMTKLFETGAHDVFWVPVQMKKNRPGILLEVLCPVHLLHETVQMILKESTSIGLRYHYVSRMKLDRKIHEINTSWGPMHVKISYCGDTVYNLSPEYEDCARVASKTGIPIKQVYQAVLQAVQKQPPT